MDAFLPGWSPELERSFKQILFRFLEHVHCTKAALYLLSPDGSYQLATQYGFGRREILTVRFEATAPVVRKARDLRTTPQAINHRDEFPEFAEALSGSGSTRMLLAPIYGGSRLAGFVDARDKGKKRPFEANDLNTVAGITKEMLQLIRTTGIVADIGVDEPEVGPEVEAYSAVAPTSRSTTIPLLDDVGLERISLLLGPVMDGEPNVLVIAMSVVSGDDVATMMVVAEESKNDDFEPVLFHQAESLRRHNILPPPPSEWKLRVTTRSQSGGGGAGSSGSQAIATSVTLVEGAWATVVSVVGPAENDRIALVLGRLEAMVLSVSGEVQARAARRRLLHSMLCTPDHRYGDLEKHSRSVAQYAWMVATELGVGAGVAEEIAMVGLMHDIGMRELDYEKIYRHPSPGPAERRAYRTHSEEGERLINELGLGSTAKAVRHHHERWDGKGYPDGLSGEEIPLSARVVHAAEVLDVLTSSSSYRNAVTEERAVAILKAESGKQFDPKVIDALLRIT